MVYTQAIAKFVPGTLVTASTSEIKKKRGVFAISAKRAEQALQLGLDETLAFLVICSGSDRTNTRSKWSVHSVRKHLGFSADRANKAVDSLTNAGVIIRKKYVRKSGSLYTFKFLGKDDEKIWLPTTLVTGLDFESHIAGREVAPSQQTGCRSPSNSHLSASEPRGIRGFASFRPLLPLSGTKGFHPDWWNRDLEIAALGCGC